MSAYQDLIFQHAKKPIGQAHAPEGSALATMENALCGDAVTVSLVWSAEQTADLGFVSNGCSLCRASASIMVATIAGQTALATRQTVANFRTTFPGLEPVPDLSDTPGLRALYDLRRYPTRQRCVLLPWDALAKLLYT